MVFRISSEQLLLLASLAVGCGPEFQASFSPLSEAGAPADDRGGPSANVSGQPAANGGGGASTGGAGPLDGNAAGAGSAGGTNTNANNAGANNAAGSAGLSTGGANGSAGATSSMAGQGGACARRCDALEPWAQRSYTLGERVSSICKAPYNGACAANTQHEFECQPPTGAVGLGWCSVRQPGVGNGWHEAWRISAACE